MTVYFFKGDAKEIIDYSKHCRQGFVNCHLQGTKHESDLPVEMMSLLICCIQARGVRGQIRCAMKACGHRKVK